VNDSGIELNDEATLQLISEISASENHYDNNNEALPWRKLEASLLQSLLEK
jgi:hypothetical protein